MRECLRHVGTVPLIFVHGENEIFKQTVNRQSRCRVNTVQDLFARCQHTACTVLRRKKRRNAEHIVQNIGSHAEIAGKSGGTADQTDPFSGKTGMKISVQNPVNTGTYFHEFPPERGS